MKKTEQLKELRKKTDAELERLKLDNAKKMIESRIAAKKHELKDTSIVSKLRGEIAKINTILTQRKFMAEKGEK